MPRIPKRAWRILGAVVHGRWLRNRERNWTSMPRIPHAAGCALKFPEFPEWKLTHFPIGGSLWITCSLACNCFVDSPHWLGEFWELKSMDPGCRVENGALCKLSNMEMGRLHRPEFPMQQDVHFNSQNSPRWLGNSGN